MCAFWSAVYMLVCCVYWLVVSMVWVYCCYRTGKRRVSRISLYYGAQTERFTCKSSPKQGQRGCNPPWFCNVRLRVLRQNQRRVAQQAETIFVLLVLGLIWLVARSTAEPLPSRPRERFGVSLATHSYSHKRKQLTGNKLAFLSGANCNAACGRPCWHERTELWGMLSGWRGLVVRCK